MGNPKKPMIKDWRREKATPRENLWHTLRPGLLIAMILFLILPYLI